MKLIKANDLKRWADSLEFRGLLPELIRRLVHATKPHLSKVYIPTEESTHSAGWDGIVVSEDNDYGAQNEAYRIERDKKTTKDVYLQQVAELRL